MARKTLHSDLDLVPRGYIINPDWNRNFRENQDNITRIVEQILDMSVREHTKYEKTMLMDVYFTKYWGWGNYCLVYKMREEYDNLELLFGAVLESTDDVLRWYDITEFVNFNIYITTPYRTFRLTYLDLLYECVTMRWSRGFVSTINNHPRLRKMKEWVLRYREYERYTKKSNLSYDPYSYGDRIGELREFFGLRNDNRPLPSQHIDILPGYSDYSRVGEDFYQRVRQISQYYNGGHIQEEQSNLTVTQRVKKESLITRLKNNLKW